MIMMISHQRRCTTSADVRETTWQSYADDAGYVEPFVAYTYSLHPTRHGESFCAVHALSDLKTRVPLMPPITYEEADYSEVGCMTSWTSMGVRSKSPK